MYYFQNNRRLFFSFNQTNNVNNKFLGPMDSSMRTNEVKKRTSATTTSKGEKRTNTNEANSALRRSRSSGYVVPAKANNKFLS
jgi:hypothetical protein